MQKKPNIIFILSDDLSYADLGCYGQIHIETPNIDKMAKEGMLFSNAYAAAPICAPSRCGILTGKHMGHARIREHGQPIKHGRFQEILHEEDYTVGNLLQNAGYATGCIGKWAVGIEGSNSIPNNKGFDYSFGFYDQEYAHTFYPEYVFENGNPYLLPENKGFDMTKRYRYNATRYDKITKDDNRYDANGNLVIEEIENSSFARNTYDLCEEKALNFITEHKNEPFFLYYCVQNPHGPLIVPSIARYMDKDFPSLRHKEWASIVSRLDEGVGKMTDLIDSLGLTNDTIFLFASDNGYSAWGYFGLKQNDQVPYFNHKGNMRGSKFTLDGEAGIKVPFIARWKGTIRKNSICKTPFAMYDLLATFTDIANCPTPSDTDGVSIKPLLLEQTNDALHPYLYWECNREQAARIGKYKAYRPYGKAKTQLYNLETDPTEKNNIARDTPSVVSEAEHIFAKEHVDNPIFISPFETSRKHKLRIKHLSLTPNCMRADSPERSKWLKKYE